MLIAAVVLMVLTWVGLIWFALLGSGPKEPPMAWGFFVGIATICCFVLSIGLFYDTVGFGWMMIAIASHCLVVGLIAFQGAPPWPFWIVELLILIIGVKFT